jgi:hypothetical protein
MDFVNDFVNGGSCSGGNALRSFVHSADKGYERVSFERIALNSELSMMVD